MGCGCDLYGKQFVNPSANGSVYSMPFQRGGPNGLFVLDVLSMNTSGSFDVSVEHRTDGGTWGTAGSFGSITTTGVATKYIAGLKKNLRYVFAFGGASAADDNVQFCRSESYSA